MLWTIGSIVRWPLKDIQSVCSPLLEDRACLLCPLVVTYSQSASYKFRSSHHHRTWSASAVLHCGVNAVADNALSLLSLFWLYVCSFQYQIILYIYIVKCNCCNYERKSFQKNIIFFFFLFCLWKILTVKPWILLASSIGNKSIQVYVATFQLEKRRQSSTL